MTAPLDDRALAAELQSLLNQGREDDAVALCRDTLESHAADPRMLALAAPFFAAIGRFQDARAAAETLLRTRPDDPRLLAQLASVCKQAGDLNAATAAADRLLSVAPDQPTAVALRADLLYLQGRYREAFEFLAPKARAAGAHPGLAVTFGRICRVEKKAWEGISALERALATPNLPPALIADAGFQLAKLYDSVDRIEQAWTALTRANRAKASHFDPDDFDRRAEAMVGAWTPEAVSRLPRLEATELPLLIVGMPRSGTTLVEQILASHPQVAPAGELADLSRAVIRLTAGLKADPPLLASPEPLNPESARRERARYLDHLHELAQARAAARVTDKMPLNALHLGLARAIAPGARVIWCRRDPMDTCVSCYFQHFGGSNPFAYDLAHLGRMSRALERIMQHWQSVLGLQILEMEYEALVADQQGGTRRLLEFAGVPWDERCLRYHESDRVAMTLSNDQVRQPVYSRSIGRWRRYEPHLGPLRVALGGV